MARRAGNRNVEPPDDGRRALQFLHVKRIKASGNAGDLALRALHGDARLETPDGGSGAAVPLRPRLRRHGERHPNVGGLAGHLEALPAMRKGETGGHHADDAVRICVEQQLLAEHVGIGAELQLPQSVADHSDLSGPGPVVIGADGAADFRRDSEGLKKLRRDA